MHDGDQALEVPSAPAWEAEVKVSLVRGGPLALASGLVLVAGCTGSDPVKEQWESRQSLPNCGSLQLRQGESLSSHGEKEVACLQQALDSGRGAELRVESPTEEGDPVTEYYRVTAEGTTEVYVDTTKDENSDQQWGYADCAKPETVLDVNC